MPVSNEFQQDDPHHIGNKAILFDYDFLNFADYAPDDTCLYCLTNKQVQIILTLLPYVGWKTRWFSPTETTIDTDLIQAIKADLADRLMSDVCTEIMDALTALDEKLDTVISKEDTIIGKEDTIIAKQDALHGLMEADTAALESHLVAQDVLLGGLLTEMTGIIEPSIALLAAAVAGVASDVSEIGDDVDNIETIITDPDDGLVEVSQDVDDIELVVAKLKNSITNITNNTIINLTFGAPDQTFTSDSKDTTQTETYARYNALCSAVVNWIYAEGYAVMSALDAPTTDLETIAAYIDAYANSLQYSMTGFTGSYIISEIYGALNDTTAVNDLACVMIGNLKDLAPTAYSFQSALNGYTPPAYPDNHKILYDTLAIAIADLNGWQTFISLFQPAFDEALSLNPTAFDCPPCGAVSDYCAIPTDWDFTLGQKTPWLIQRGVLQPGVGIVGQQIPGDLNFGIDMSIYWPTPCTAILSHNIEVGHAHLSNVGNAWTVEFYYLLAGVETRYNQSNRSQSAAWPAIDADSFAIQNPPGGAGIYRIRFYTNTPYYANATSAAATASKITYFKLKT
jgi:hypothetical protein